jgi:hypothetical protein
LPYWDEKPTVYIRSTFPDHRKRMYNSNAIGRIADKVVSNVLKHFAYRQELHLCKPFSLDHKY